MDLEGNPKDQEDRKDQMKGRRREITPEAQETVALEVPIIQEVQEVVPVARITRKAQEEVALVVQITLEDQEAEDPEAEDPEAEDPEAEGQEEEALEEEDLQEGREINQSITIRMNSTKTLK